MRTGTEFIRLPIVLFTMLLLASCGNDGPSPEDTAVDVARKFMIHLFNEEYEEAGEYCLGSVYSYDVMRGVYEHVLLPEVEKHFDDVDDYLDAVDFDSPEIIREDHVIARRGPFYREDYGVEGIAGAEEVWLNFRKGLDGLFLEVPSGLRIIKHEGVWKMGGAGSLEMVCRDKKALSIDEKKHLGLDE